MSDEHLQRLLDEEEIKRVHLRYCRGVDRMDWDLIRTCYHPDALDHHGDYVGNVEGFILYAKENLSRFTSTNHCVCNQIVDVNGDIAYAEHYGIAYHRIPATDGEPAKDWIANIRYIDRIERRGGQWRIANRQALVDSDNVVVATESLLPADQIRGRRDRQDASYVRQ